MESNRQYFERRAEQEQKAAAAAKSVAAQQRHRALANRYRELLEADSERPATAD
jgi:hypothetical protein